MSRVLVIPDLHSPFIRKYFIEFLIKTYKEYKCNKVVLIGDLFDWHRVSRHLAHPDAMGSKEEYLRAIEQLKPLYKAFPKAKVCIGNHDARFYKQIAEKAVPSVALPGYKEWTKCPQMWEWELKHIVDGVLYMHGTKAGGDYPHVNTVRKTRMSTVIGHIHTVAGTQWLASDNDLIFGMAVGCGMDSKSYAAAYAEENLAKPIVSCGVVLEGKLPILVPMELGSKVKILK